MSLVTIDPELTYTIAEIDQALADLLILRQETAVALSDEDFALVPNTNDLYDDDNKDIGKFKVILNLLNSDSVLKLTFEGGEIRYIHERTDNQSISVYDETITFLANDTLINNSNALSVYMNQSNIVAVYQNDITTFFTLHAKNAVLI